MKKLLIIDNLYYINWIFDNHFYNFLSFYIQLLLLQSLQILDTVLEGCILYTSAECCPMCLCAAYWAHVEHIFYAASVDDALKYGEFKDVNFYEQVCQPKDKRLIGMTQKMQKEAVEVWKAFSVMPDRARY